MDKEIELFIDETNNDNVWGIIRYKNKQGAIPKTREEFVRFENFYSMFQYVTNNFDSSSIFRHMINYSYILYNYYNGHPEKDHLEIRYLENIGDKKVEKKLKMPKELTDTFINILRINKRIPYTTDLDSSYFRSVDVYQKRANDRKEIKRSIKMSIDEFVSISGEKIKTIKENKAMVKALKIVASFTVIAGLITAGIHVVRDYEDSTEYLRQYNPIRNVQDVDIYFNKGKAGAIIEKLVQNDYEDIDINDIKMITEFLKNVENSNYDNNASRNSLNLSDYLGYRMELRGKIVGPEYDVLDKIDKLYNQCFRQEHGKVVLNNKTAKEYINFVASLAFMYDDYHNIRPSLIRNTDQSITSPYADSRQISAYDNYPPIIQYIILNQLRGVIVRSDYKVDRLPAYYFDFDGIDKSDLLREIDERMNNIIDELFINCSRKSENKTV